MRITTPRKTRQTKPYNYVASEVSVNDLDVDEVNISGLIVDASIASIQNTSKSSPLAIPNMNDIAIVTNTVPLFLQDQDAFIAANTDGMFKSTISNRALIEKEFIIFFRALKRNGDFKALKIWWTSK